MRYAILTLFATLNLTMLAQPASACSCGQGSVAEIVAGAESVYVARPHVAPPDPGSPTDPNYDPGGTVVHTFKVERVLKGEPRATVGVMTPPLGWSSCAVAVPDDLYVIPVPPGTDLGGYDLCTENARGEDAVREAEALFGPGTAPPTRGGSAWLIPWGVTTAVVLAGASTVAAVRRR